MLLKQLIQEYYVRYRTSTVLESIMIPRQEWLVRFILFLGSIFQLTMICIKKFCYIEDN